MTCSRICRPCINVIIVMIFGVAAVAQSLDPSALLEPAADSWPTYHGDYTGQRHSKLAQITPANVHQLTLAWAFQTNQPQQIKATPILVNGVIYITTPDNLWAIDARSGRQIVGLDLNEVTPERADSDGSGWDENVGARLLYRLIGFALRSQS